MIQISDTRLFIIRTAFYLLLCIYTIVKLIEDQQNALGGPSIYISTALTIFLFFAVVNGKLI